MTNEKRLVFTYDTFSNEYSGAMATWQNPAVKNNDPEYCFHLFYDEKNDLWRIGLHSRNRKDPIYHEYTIPFLARGAFENLVDMMNERLLKEGWVIE